MTRGKFLLFAEENGERKIYCSTEFNGDMYIDGGHGDEILNDFIFPDISNFAEYKEYVESFNKKHFEYDDNLIVDEITKEGLAKCPHEFVCSKCKELDTCKIWYSFSGSDIYDVTTYNCLSDYLYVLNTTLDDIEMFSKSGIVLIPSGEGAVFNFNRFLDTKWEAHLISPEESDFFEEKGKIITLTESCLTAEEAEEWVNSYAYTYCTGDIIIYDNAEVLAESHLLNTGNIPEEYFHFVKLEELGNDLCNGDGYYKLSSGKIISYY